MINTKFVRHISRGFVLWDCITEISHLDMVRRLGFEESDVRSAGFVRFEPGTALPVCEGHSGSLNLGSSAGDTQALRRQLGISTPGQPPRMRLEPTIYLGGGATL